MALLQTMRSNKKSHDFCAQVLQRTNQACRIQLHHLESGEKALWQFPLVEDVETDTPEAARSRKRSMAEGRRALNGRRSTAQPQTGSNGRRKAAEVPSTHTHGTREATTSQTTKKLRSSVATLQTTANGQRKTANPRTSAEGGNRVAKARRTSQYPPSSSLWQELPRLGELNLTPGQDLYPPSVPQGSIALERPYALPAIEVRESAERETPLLPIMEPPLDELAELKLVDTFMKDVTVVYALLDLSRGDLRPAEAETTEGHRPAWPGADVAPVGEIEDLMARFRPAKAWEPQQSAESEDSSEPEVPEPEMA